MKKSALTNPKNWKVKNLKYIIQATYKKFIRKEYQRFFGPDNIDDMLYKTARCHECYLNGSCLYCGCNFKEMITTKKPCPEGKF